MDQSGNHRSGPANPKDSAEKTCGTHQPTSTASANDPFYSAAVGAAKTRAYKAAVTAGLSPNEREDLYQEILLDIYERKGQFDPSRGGPGTFTGLVSTHRTADFLNARKADKKKLVFAEPEYIDTLEVVAIDRQRFFGLLAIGSDDGDAALLAEGRIGQDDLVFAVLSGQSILGDHGQFLLR